MNNLKEYIDVQLKTNRSKNLFYKDFSHVENFPQSTIDVLRNRNIAAKDVCALINYTTEKVVQELFRVNQYFAFSEHDTFTLKKLYWETYQYIHEQKCSVNDIFNVHFQNLKKWLEITNPFSRGMYQAQGVYAESVACFEYSSGLQKEILCLNKIQLLEPILDIGCGKNGSLVKSFIRDNVDAHGIDRILNAPPYFEKADWLTYNYGTKKWGTIVSNLGFSNHFVHHHVRNDGNIQQYAKKYMEILQSLKTGGHFCYAPDVPFIEMHLDKKSFSVTKHEIKNVPFKTTIITRLD